MTAEESYKYRAIARDLRVRIRSGDLAPGALVPSKAALKDQYGVSDNTVADAIKVLRAEGLVRPDQGRGTFVCDPLPDEEQGLSPEFTKFMERMDGMEAEIRRQAERIDQVEREQQRLRGQ